MIGIINTGIGNIPSVLSALKKIEKDTLLCTNKNDLDKVKKIILPGVGSFKVLNEKINETELFYPIQNKVKNGIPILGICLGFHALYEKSIEYGVFKGLDLIKGEVVNINSLKKGIKIPHIGWNSCKFHKDSKLFKGIKDESDFYFTHSYTPINYDNNLVSTFSNYEVDLVSAIEKENIFGVQFHPEKSQKNGLRLLKNFCEIQC